MKNPRKVIVVYKKSTLQMYEKKIKEVNLQKKNTELYEGIMLAHEEHLASLNLIKNKLKNLSIPVLFHRRGDKKMPAIRDNDIVVALGGDGTFIFASHFVKNATMVGINSAPDFSIGHFCRYNLFDKDLDLKEEMENIISGKNRPTDLYRLKVMVNNELVHIPVINDMLIVDSNPATTTRYTIDFNGMHYYQKSSGIWLSTAMGSSAAFTSSGGKPFLQFNKKGERQFGLRVREAYRPDSGTLLQALVTEKDTLKITISMIDGYIFFDGGQKKIKIKVGDIIKIEFDENPLKAIVKKKE